MVVVTGKTDDFEPVFQRKHFEVKKKSKNICMQSKIRQDYVPAMLWRINENNMQFVTFRLTLNVLQNARNSISETLYK